MVPLFVELCAGTAALSLRLHARGARPPVSRMGAKTGYADAILRVLGLAPGTRAAHYLWCEPDAGVRLLLEAYRDADLARAAAAIIRSWADEEPRALWERLRAEGPPVLPATGAEVARWSMLRAWSVKAAEDYFRGPGGVSSGEHERSALTIEGAAVRFDTAPTLPASIAPDARTVDPREVARWVVTAEWAYQRGNPATGYAPRGEPRLWSDGYVKTQRAIGPMAEGVGRVLTLPATITPDARTVDPREVARWVWTWGRSFNTKGPEAGFLPDQSANGTPVWNAHPPGWYADACDALPTLPATIAPDARDLHPPALPPGTIAYLDPPYLGTTGYASDLPRSEVVTLARRWHAAGAVVCVSEAEAIPDLVADGWYAVRIDGERVGQKRTFSKQQAEYLTLSHPPAWRPSVQGGLFGALSGG